MIKQVSLATVAVVSVGVLAGCGGASKTAPAPGGEPVPSAATAKPVGGEIKGVLPAHTVPTLFYIDPAPGTVRSDAERARIQHDVDAAQYSEPDASGRFVIRNVLPGKYALFVRISASESRQSSVPPFTVSPGQKVDLGTVRVRQK